MEDLEQVVEDDIWRLPEFIRSLANLSATTTLAYGDDIGRFRQWCSSVGVFEPQEISRLLVRRWVAEISRSGLSASTANRRLAAVRKYAAYLRTYGVLLIDPTEQVRAPAKASRLPRVLSQSEVTDLLDRPPTQLDPGDTASATAALWASQDQAVLELLYSSGLRVAELCGLTDRAWDRRSNMLTIRGKGNKERVVPIGQPAAVALAAWIDVE